MNVLETANILFDYYTPVFVRMGIVNNKKIQDPGFKYIVNDNIYDVYLNSIWDPNTSNMIPGNELRIQVSSRQENNVFEHSCNEIERLDILRKMDEVSKKWYKNYVEKIKVPIPNNNFDPVIEMKSVEVTAPSDLV
jgi:hypothetical protein